MALRQRVFQSHIQTNQQFSISDVVMLLIIITILAIGMEAALSSPEIISGPDIRLNLTALPLYSLLSIGRMFFAYVLSLIFSIVYGYAAAQSKTTERWLLPLLDILQSVPILSFLPVVLLSLTAILPQRIAIELAAIILIFTSQTWNLTFSFYQSMTTLPNELREAAAIFRFSRWLRFRIVELPFAALGLIWNSVMSWAGGWFFLMAAEIFTLGNRDFRLPGLGSYLSTAANKGDTSALIYGILSLVAIIILLDQLVWQPLLAWAERFKVSQVEEEHPTTSWFLNGLRRSGFAYWLREHFFSPLFRRIDQRLNQQPHYIASLETENTAKPSALRYIFLSILMLGIGYGIVQAIDLIASLSPDDWLNIAIGALATFIRVTIAVTIALIWTIPVGVIIGTKPRIAAILQPIVQIVASIPATALFPILLLGLIDLPTGPNIAAILLMLLGTQWYLLFNVIAGASAIPQDLQYTTDIMGLHGWRRWRTLILPALFPYIITGLITSSGGAWNASIVAEYTHFGGQTSKVVGLGAVITESTEVGNYPLLLASTLTMIILVVIINRIVWRRLYRLAEEQYRLDQ
ncbi:MAG: ABC transporter permease [Patescibacteria group bacterium]|nr:MAG: ABC transporter permease [Patescibacteria group bacterium]